MRDITASIQLGVPGQNEYRHIPVWRTSDGGLFLPRVGEVVFQDGAPFEVIDVEWRYVQTALMSIVVIAVPAPVTEKRCGCQNRAVFDGKWHSCSLTEHAADENCKCLCGKGWTYVQHSAVEIS